MSKFLTIFALLISASAFATISVTTPRLSPNLGEYESGAQLVDEHSVHFRTFGVLLPDSSGHSNIPSAKFAAAPVSQVTAREGFSQYKLASGQMIPVISLVGINTSSDTAIPLVFPTASISPLSADLDAGSHKVINLANPTSAQDAATKAYVDKTVAITCSAGVGGAATEALTCTGLLTTDTVLAVTQKTPGANSLPLLGWSTLANNGITGIWSADPGAGSVVMVLVKHQ